MQTRQRRLLAALQRAQGFLDAHRAALASVNASETRITLDATIEEMMELGQFRDPTRFRRRQEQETERRHRLAVRTLWMTPIARIARTSFPHTEEYRRLRLPATNVNTVGFVLAARAMLFAAEAEATTFVRAGLAPDFPDQMASAIDEFEKAVAVRERNKSARVGATARLKFAASEGRGIVRIIDALIVPVIASDESARADWASTKQMLSRAVAVDEEPAVEARPDQHLHTTSPDALRDLPDAFSG